MSKKEKLNYLPVLDLAQALTTAKSSLDRQVKARLYESLGEDMYKTWVHPNGFVALGIKNGEPEFDIANPFVAVILQQRFSHQLQQAFKE